MAAAIVPKPGSKFGPCKKACAHIDCRESRQIAESLCHVCRQPIEYETRYYRHDDAGGAYDHARCVES